MSVINVLDKKVYSQISAGEVVEKTASIVKELVENSLDAGAKNITIEINQGGTTLISITDDGCGISEDDIVNAFLPHATSKLKQIDDLQTLNSMGFRGEALASISAVTNVEMITKTANQDMGIKINLSGADVVSKSNIACVTGTKIIVSDLFFNTPARAKFLRKTKTEENDITLYVEKLMLSRSDVNFKYIVDSKIIYNTTNCSVIDIIYTIYGKEVADNLVEINYKTDSYYVHGYIGKPVIAKANRTYQTLFVNKRFCQNAMISTSISNAYDNYLMKGKFPFFVLFLDLSPELVDVNVHPNKLEVKFQDFKKVYGIFNFAISNALADLTHIEYAINEDINDFKSVDAVDQEVLPTIKENEGVSFSQKVEEPIIEEKITIKEPVKFDYNTNMNLSKEELLNTKIIPNEFGKTADLMFSKSNILDEISIEVENNKKENESNINSFSQKGEQQVYSNLFAEDKKIIGTAFDTYVIVQEGDNLYFIDQHAAHERQLFDKFTGQVNSQNVISQDLLMPYVLNLSSDESDFIENNIDNFNDYGFGIEPFGKNCFKVSSIPLLLSEINLKEYFNDVLSNLSQLLKKPIDVIRNTFATMACKAAVKGGNKLSQLEIDTLINTLKEKNTTLLCPHGRPICVVFEKKQIEKMFKRIV